MRNSYLKKTGQVLFISQKSETELETDRPQGFYK